MACLICEATGRRLHISQELHDEAPTWCALRKKCWAQTPHSRPTFKEIWEELEEQRLRLLPSSDPHQDHLRRRPTNSTLVHGDHSVELEQYTRMQ